MTRLHLYGLAAFGFAVLAALGIAWWGQRRNPAADDTPAPDLDEVYRQNIRALWEGKP